eukprot:CAMPEP_0175085096 /NCGR_PEP_ID=MMETSP0052_2-20121109/28456_1 /TAXON_ID=51329 ORGANISM="Polytomella parva, Strain SAG 63-3" /NCGR_SAMPLE_ID=MMETSP0052_2 /ASSEMBLY_ACC=CAM_ASM_000194 /LENGTH=850 /DNA_ID=CAMNT_0016357035 /DNA_START=29 /DNA_END=2577 /DNA_ORIENTATION=+
MEKSKRRAILDQLVSNRQARLARKNSQISHCLSLDEIECDLQDTNSDGGHDKYKNLFSSSSKAVDTNYYTYQNEDEPSNMKKIKLVNDSSFENVDSIYTNHNDDEGFSGLSSGKDQRQKQEYMSDKNMISETIYSSKPGPCNSSNLLPFIPTIDVNKSSTLPSSSMKSEVDMFNRPRVSTSSSTNAAENPSRLIEDLILGDHSEYRLDASVVSQLYSYQIEGVRWLWSRHAQGIGGILGDDMGLGKTRQCAAFLTGLFSSSLVRRIIIAAPKTLLTHWRRELSNCGLGNITYDFYGTDCERRRSLENVRYKGGIILTTHGLIQHNVQQLFIEEPFQCNNSNNRFSLNNSSHNNNGYTQSSKSNFNRNKKEPKKNQDNWLINDSSSSEDFGSHDGSEDSDDNIGRNNNSNNDNNKINDFYMNNNNSNYDDEDDDCDDMDGGRNQHAMNGSFGRILNFKSKNNEQPFWDYAFVDEGHRFKNPGTKMVRQFQEIPVRIRILLTGTPIQNNYLEMHTLFDITTPGLLGDRRTFQRKIAKVIEKGQSRRAPPAVLDEGNAAAARLRHLIEPFFLRRLKSDVLVSEKEGASGNIGVIDGDGGVSNNNNDDNGNAHFPKLHGIHNTGRSEAFKTTKNGYNGDDGNDGDEDGDNANANAESGLNENQKAKSQTLPRKDDFVVWLRLSPLQVALYESYLHSDDVDNAVNKRTSKLKVLTVLKKLCDHPALQSTDNVQAVMKGGRIAKRLGLGGVGWWVGTGEGEEDGEGEEEDQGESNEEERDDDGDRESEENEEENEEENVEEDDQELRHLKQEENEEENEEEEVEEDDQELRHLKQLAKQFTDVPPSSSSSSSSSSS